MAAMHALWACLIQTLAVSTCIHSFHVAAILNQHTPSFPLALGLALAVALAVALAFALELGGGLQGAGFPAEDCTLKVQNLCANEVAQ